jgi:acetyltransferase-like isoleucine patch superfamily enzyme
VTWQGFTTKGPTRIGDNVWCGANVVVTSGVTIGERAVVGANSVVTTDVAPYSIVAGAPARVVKPDWRLPGVGGLGAELPTSS